MNEDLKELLEFAAALMLLGWFTLGWLIAAIVFFFSPIWGTAILVVWLLTTVPVLIWTLLIGRR